MVARNMDAVVVPHPPSLPSIADDVQPTPQLPKIGSVRSKMSTGSNGFRLQEAQDDACSVYSVYKQKIDSMFESDSSGGKTQNSVQARIEKMFTDIAGDDGPPVNDFACHTFSVDYLGSVPLQEKVTSLDGLQTPLRQLYFAHKRSSKHKKPLTGRLEISPSGLKVQYQGEKGDLEQLNSFPTIAVWSAVKFVLQGGPKSSPSYAFLPLITDPDNIEKQQLFRNLEDDEVKLVTAEAHSPLFAVVMRKMGAHRQLDCHGFLCQTSEDAIVIAATLYKSLMAHMKAKEKKPRNRNGITCMSIASSTCNDAKAAPVRPPRKKRSGASSVKSDADTLDTTETQPLLHDPDKLARRSVKSKKADDLDAILPYEEPSKEDAVDQIKPSSFLEKFNTYRSNHQKQIAAEIKQVMTESANMGLKRVKSVRKRNEDGIISKGAENSGDILTKVTIPRSGSFLNAGGLTRYKSKVHRTNGQATGGSPLGFSELFNEFRLQEGLHSVDEILGVIIDPEGMSFNDLKPIYKEFLLKLALTLTKDELYQRSKLIMRRQKKKLLPRNVSLHGKKRPVVVYNKFKRLKHIFDKIRRRTRANHKTQRPLLPDEQHELNANKLPESSISSSSYDTRQFRPREQAHQVTRKQSYRKRLGDPKCGGARRERASTSEESDFFSLRRKQGKVQTTGSNPNRNSSSGYVSCSECSYDSDTCTCVSADKCYCSLGNKSFARRPGACKNSLDSCRARERCYCTMDRHDPVWCGCDTDSCTDSNKCYCSARKGRGGESTIFEQLKQRGFIPSTDAVVTPPSHRKLCKKSSNTRSTRSLEYMHNPNEKYYEKLRSKSRIGNYDLQSRRRNSYGNSDNLALDYELFSIANGNYCSISNRSLYGRGLSEIATPMKARHQVSSVRSYGSSKYNQIGKTLQSAPIPVGACTEALSVKKSAEIAALFADIKLSQTTDIAHLVSGRRVEQESLVACRNAYNKQRSSTKCNARQDRHDPMSLVPHGNRMILGAAVKNMAAKTNMYSAQNGLYTIQSQSDDSRSSLGKKSGKRKEEVFDQDGDNSKPVSAGLENSLGYLP